MWISRGLGLAFMCMWATIDTVPSACVCLVIACFMGSSSCRRGSAGNNFGPGGIAALGEVLE
eukprot:1415316-Pleurochrysis_carterae.AAC.1